MPCQAANKACTFASVSLPTEDVMRRLLAALVLVLASIGVAQAECYPPWNARQDLRAVWYTPDCRYQFPPRDGFAGAAHMVWLKPGTMLDRFGSPGGAFLAPADASYMGRAVPYDRLKMAYYRYEVLRPLRVAAGKAAPWFDQPGGGIQYKTGRKIAELVAAGYLRPAW